MTRDFNKQRRGDVRPSSRRQPPSRQGEERSPRPARPRLNRETVDRAWESGAPQNHADYRTRNSYGQAPRGNWRSNQQSEHSPTQNSRRPFGNRQDTNRRFERTPNGNPNPRSRSFDQGKRNFDDRRFNDRRSYSEGQGGRDGRPDYYENTRSNDRRSYSEGQGATGARPGYYEKARYRDQGSQFRDRDQSQGDQRRDPERRNRPPFRDFDRDNRSPRNFERGNRSPRDRQQPDTQNPRWQSRPAQRDNYPRRSQDFTRDAPQDELFEGDYERFDRHDAQRRPSDRPLQDSPGKSRQQAEDRRVTRLPDGHVIKGPRPAQRKNSEFWTDVSHDAEALVNQVASSPTEDKAKDKTSREPADPIKADATEQSKTKKPRSRAASAIARGKKVAAKKGTVKPKPPANVPRPSQKGFKWPTPER